MRGISKRFLAFILAFMMVSTSFTQFTSADEAYVDGAVNAETQAEAASVLSEIPDSAEEMPAAEETPSVDEVPAAEENTSVEGNPAADDTTAAEGNTSANDTAAADGNPVAEENTSAEGNTSADDTAAAEGNISADDTTAAEGNTSADDTAAAEGNTSANDTAAAEGKPAANDTASAEGNPSADNTTDAQPSKIADDVDEIIVDAVQEAADRFEAECAITGSDIIDGVAYAAYHSNVSGSIQVKIYDEASYNEDAENTAAAYSDYLSVEATVSGAGDTTVSLPIVNGSIPEYFYMEVILMNEEGAVIDSYMNTNYTEGIQNVLNAASPDSVMFNRVVFLDSACKSYYILAENMAIIADGQGYSITFDGSTVTVSGIPKALAGLDENQLAGIRGITFMVDGIDVTESGYYSGFYYTSSSNTTNMLPVLVQDGCTIAVNEEENTISFPYVPIDGIEITDVISGIHYDSESEDNGAAYYSTLSDIFTFTIKESANGGTVVGTIKPDISPDGSFTWDGWSSYVEISLEIGFDYSLTMTGATTNAEYTINSNPEFTVSNSISVASATYSIPLFYGVNAGVRISFKALFNAPGTVEGTAKIGMGLKISIKDPSAKGSKTVKVKAEPDKFIQIALETSLEFSIGVSLIIKTFNFVTAAIRLALIEHFIKENVDEKCIHYCMVDPIGKGCSQWQQNTSVMGYLAAVLNIVVKSFEWDKKLFTISDGAESYYYSRTYNDLGPDICPHKGWPVTVTVKYADGTLVKDAEVSVPNYDKSSDTRVKKNTIGKTDEKGQVVIYIPKCDSAEIKAVKGTRNGKTEEFSVAYGDELEKTIIIPAEYEVNIEWKDASNKSEKRPESVELHIEKKAEEDTDWVTTEEKIEVTDWKDDKGSGKTEVTSEGEHRARLDAEEKEYTYTKGPSEESETIKVVDLGGTLYKVEYKDEKGEEGSGTTTVTLTEMKQFSIEIKWDADFEGKDHPTTVKAELQSPSGVAKDVLDAEVWFSEEQIEVGDDTGWTGEFIPVPAYTDDNKEITYRVREIRSIADAVDEYLDLPVWAKDDKDTAADLWEKIPGNERNLVSYDVEAYNSVIKGGQVDKHSTKYQASYAVDGGKTTVTNLAVVDVTVYKKWAMLGEAKTPDSVYLMVQSRVDSDFLEDGATNPWTPAYDPISGPQIKVAELFPSPIDTVIGALYDGSLPFAIGKTTEAEGWKVQYRLKKYSVAPVAGLPLEFQGVEAASGALKDIIQYVSELLTGFDLSKYIDFISFNPIDGYFSAYLPKAMPIPGLGEGSLYTLVTNFWYKGSDDEKANTIGGTKVWEDNDNKEGKRPESVTVHLLKDGKRYQDFVLNEDNSWSWMYTVPAEDKGAVFTAEEDAIDYYEVSYNGLNAVNRYTGKKAEDININVIVKWEDDNDRDGLRPDDLTIKLLADDKDTGKAILVSDGTSWEENFRNVAAYDADEKEITYTLNTPDVKEYEKTVSGSARKGFVVTYKHTGDSSTISISGSKTWKDEGHEDARPAEGITINLLANGKKVDSKTVTAADGWAWSFEDKPVFEKGEEIIYSITEDPVANYDTTIEEYSVINTYKEGVTSFSISKVWDDDNDRDQIRPRSVTVRLLKNGEDAGQVVMLSEENSWTGTLTDIPLDDIKSYSVQEDPLGGDAAGKYESTTSGSPTEGFTITNTHKPETVNVTGVKTWFGDNKSLRPDSITVRLLANGSEKALKIVTPNENGTWRWEFNGLPKYEDGNEITYSVIEDAVENYNSTDFNEHIFNIYSRGKTSVMVSKVWDDENNQDGKRPDSVIVRIYAKGKELNSLVLDESNEWHDTFIDLDIYDENGSKIEYTVTEDAVAEYTSEITGDQSKGFSIKNSHTPVTTKVVVTKKWNDIGHEDWRPVSIMVRLLADNYEVDAKTITKDSDGNWQCVFENLPAYKDGELIDYNITEDCIENYDVVSVTETRADNQIEFEITNEYDLANTSVFVSKKWDDGNNRDGKRPGEVVVKLLANGSDAEKELHLSDANHWQDIFTDLPKYDSEKQLIQYTIEEEKIPEYVSVISGDQSRGYVITNTHEPERINITGTKTWVGDSKDDRPILITVKLLSNGVLKREVDVKADAEGNWSYEFTNLHKYKNGAEIVYTIEEVPVDDYYTEYEYNFDKDNDIYTADITNYYQKGKVNIPVTKVWEDDDNRDGIRPEKLLVTLVVDGVDSNTTIELNEADGWKGSFDGLTTYEKDHKFIYTVKEENIPNYTSATTGDAETGFTFTNTHEPEQIDIEGEKTWVDSCADLRPEYIVIRLWAGEGENKKEVDSQEVRPDEKGRWAWTFKDKPMNLAGKEIVYTITEDPVNKYESVVNSFDVTNTYVATKTEVNVTKVWDDDDDRDAIRPDEVIVTLYQNGTEYSTLKLSEANGWTDVFKDLPVDDTHADYIYTVSENPVTGYTTEVTGTAKDGFVITNTHELDKITLSGKKTWVGDNESVRPEMIRIVLLLNDIDYKDLYVKADKDGNWTWTFDDLYKNKNGKEITYTVEELPIDGYYTVYDGMDITNYYQEGIINIPVTKVWDDDDDRDGLRPEKLVITLMIDGKESATTIELNEANNWSASFDNLPSCDKEHVFTYAIKETAVEGYTSVTVGDTEKGYTITNTHESAKKDISGKKTWMDDSEQLRPESIMIRLLADGVEVASQKVTADKDGNWSWKFEGMPVNNKGVRIVYTITEDAIEDYSTEINGFDVVNTHHTAYFNLPVTKVWNDHNDREHKRPEEITVKLLADGRDTGKTLKLSAANNWTASFTNLPKDDGKAYITYTVYEEKVEGYTTLITGDAANGFVITNTLPDPKPETGDSNNIMMWLALMLAGILGLAAAFRRLLMKR